MDIFAECQLLCTTCKGLAGFYGEDRLYLCSCGDSFGEGLASSAGGFVMTAPSTVSALRPGQAQLFEGLRICCHHACISGYKCAVNPRVNSMSQKPAIPLHIAV